MLLKTVDKIDNKEPIFRAAITAASTARPNVISLDVFADEQGVALAAANFVAKQLYIKPNSVLLLPTGRTPLLMYSQLIEMLHTQQPDLNQLQTFNLDEFYNLTPEHPGSYHTYMQRVLFDYMPISPAHIHLLNSAAPDPVAECAAYEAQIKEAGGIDVAVLGIGANGHIGFNEPGSSLDSRTRLVTIQPETRAANAFLFDNKLEAVPTSALTVGIATIMEARRILLIATGSSKAQAILAMLKGPITPDLPASYLQLHPDVSLLVDEKAATQMLKAKLN